MVGVEWINYYLLPPEELPLERKLLPLECEGELLRKELLPELRNDELLLEREGEEVERNELLRDELELLR